MVRLTIDWWRGQDGATSIEYAMIASVVSIVIAGILFGLGETVSTLFSGTSAGFS